MPEPLFIIQDRSLATQVAEQLAGEVSAEQKWTVQSGSFYEHYGAAWFERAAPWFERYKTQHDNEAPAFRVLYEFARQTAERDLNAVIGRHYTITCNKIVEGQGIGIHNDSPQNLRGTRENFRLLFYVDKEYVDDKGGYLYLLSGPSSDDVVEAIRPIFNTTVCMELSKHSFHAVSRVKSGERYTIVVSMWGYPLLHHDAETKHRASKCIAWMIGSGLEDRPHSGTSLSYHLYNTYEILSRWGAPAVVCLAGLMHSTLGRRTDSLISRKDLQELVGKQAGEIVEWLSQNSGFEVAKSTPSELERAGFLVELANALEQPQTAGELQEMRRVALSPEWLSKDLILAIGEEIGLAALRRALVENYPGRKKEAHHGAESVDGIDRPIASEAA